MVLFGKFLDANIVVIFVIQREEGVHLLDLIPVVLFCPDDQSSLLRIPHSLAVRRLNFEVGSKDGHRILGFSFEWPDAATSLSCHLETLVLMCALFTVRWFGILFVTVTVDRV
jgi:hypothetical protein